MTKINLSSYIFNISYSGRQFTNTMKTTFEFNFDLNYAVKQHGYKKNREVKRIYHLKKGFSLITCKLVIRKKLLYNQT